MKKILLTISIIAALGLSAGAQQSSGMSDGFFTSTYNDYDNINRDDTFRADDIQPLFPNRIGEGFETPWDQDADPAPLGTGIMLLAGMGAIYAMRKRKE